ncbi:hypothetical protein SNE25_16030 [Mucilaginibacter sabulilitoris]|uniref:Uncharacterized protein n=1 Tax=Mucilaginibacter sabulilitoris TaxID=1173583 RepID=A0ABZ0TVA9_9SPHI|nr:hypothetical protein [Mucilaginibacter sabulilitoris]WPU97031.1 hypothetical protein SNE25_16030 [Mucilaginibacter sabulilitoris]
MQIVHINHHQTVKTAANKIIDLFSRETVKLRTIYHHLYGVVDTDTRQFTGFIA